MKNYIQDGKTLTLTALAAVLSGDGHLVGNIFGVANTDTLISAAGEFDTEGVFELAALTTATAAQGDKAYWDNANKRVDSVSTVGPHIGEYALAKTNGQTIATVRLEGIVRAAWSAQPAPTAKTVAVTLTIAELLNRIITATHTAGATAAYTLPTGANVDGGLTMAIDESFDWSLINLSAAALDSVTVTASSGHTIVGNPIVQSAHVTTGGIYGNSAIYRTRKTAANTFVSYRIA